MHVAYEMLTSVQMAQNIDTRTDDLYSTTVTPNEAAAGFVLGSIATPFGTHNDSPFIPLAPRTVAVVRDLGDNLRAVKILFPKGEVREVQYAIYNVANQPVQPVAYSLAELERRFPQTG